MDTVSYLTINGDTREIADIKSRDDISSLQTHTDNISLLQAQINYIAEELNIDLSQITVPSSVEGN